MKYTILSEKEIKTALIHLPEWQYLPDIPALYAEFVFPAFLQTIDFMQKAAPFIDTLNHHPEWTNVYNKLKITLYTHDVQAITTLDVELAQHLSQLYKNV